MGESATLTWDSANAVTITIEPDIGDVDLSGSVAVSLMETTTYTITATGLGGTATADVTVTVTSPITLTITSPTEGETINRPDTMVQGTFTNSLGNETGIVVNGVLALVHGSNFVANHVPLQEGENTITASATDTAGYKAKDSITVTAEIIGDYITVTAIPESGIAILETTLTIDTPFTPTDIDIVKLAGPEPLEYLPGSEPNEILIRMDQVGLYYFLAVAEDDQSNSYTDTIAVQVLDEAALDALLKAKWDGMKTALGNGDIETAVAYIAENAKEMYEFNFNLMSAHLVEISAGLQDIGFVHVRDGVAEYEMIANQNGQDYSFHILFVMDSDGIWRIKFF